MKGGQKKQCVVVYKLNQRKERIYLLLPLLIVKMLGKHNKYINTSKVTYLKLTHAMTCANGDC